MKTNKLLIALFIVLIAIQVKGLAVEANDFVLFFNTSKTHQSVGLYVDGESYSKYIVGVSSEASPAVSEKLSIRFAPAFILIIPRSVENKATITIANNKAKFSFVKGGMKDAPVLYVMLSDDGNMTTAQMGESVLEAIADLVEH